MHLQKIITCASHNEFNQHALEFVSSICFNSPGQKVIIYVMDPDAATVHLRDSLLLRSKAIDLEIIMHRRDPRYSVAAAKLHILRDHLADSQQDILFLDITCSINADLLMLQTRLEHVDFAYTVQNSAIWWPAVLWINQKRRTRKIVSSLLLHWAKLGTDFVTYMQDNRPRLKVALLDSRIISTNPATQAAISYPETGSDMASQEKKIRQQLFLAHKNIAIVILRIDCPFKPGISFNRAASLRRLKDSTRLYWQYFPKLIRDAYLQNAQAVDLYCLPAEEITHQFVTSLGHERIYIPHAHKRQIPDPRVQFYMQEMYPFLFTIDSKGWGALSAQYQSSDYLELTDCSQAEEFCSIIQDKRITKYKQTGGRVDDFDVFFPLQIADDVSLVEGSEHRLEDIVYAVMDWANQYKVRVVFKSHPIRPSLAFLKRKKQSQYVRFIQHGNVLDLIAQSKVVFVANSGVGFETLVQHKPLVTFARAIYDVVSVKAQPTRESIQKAYLAALSQEQLKPRYLQFLQWYLYQIGYLMQGDKVSIPTGDGRYAVSSACYAQEMASFSDRLVPNAAHRYWPQKWIKQILERFR